MSEAWPAETVVDGAASVVGTPAVVGTTAVDGADVAGADVAGADVVGAVEATGELPEQAARDTAAAMATTR